MQKKFTKEMVDEYADKLLIGLTEEENEMVLLEFDVIDESIDRINNIKNIESIEPMSHCIDIVDFELDEDEITPSIEIEDMLKNCDSYRDNEIKVPKVVE